MYEKNPIKQFIGALCPVTRYNELQRVLNGGVPRDHIIKYKKT